MKSFKLLLLLALLYTLNAQDDEPTCGFEHNEDHEFLDIEEDTSGPGEGRVLASYPNLRIYADYSRITASAPSSYTAYIKKELAPPVISYFEAALKVKYPVVGKLKLGSSVRTACGKPVPSILKTGVTGDYVILFDSKSVSGTVVASSGYCYLASGSKRPFVAHTTFNRPMMRVANGDVLLHEKNTYLLIHEMLHTFGVADGTYKYFRDANGNTRRGHVKSVSIGGTTRTVLNVAPLTERLRKFYGCSSIPGLLLENNGGSGTVGAHFERKLFPYEAMSSGGINGRRVSEFSLALLEGSGWYAPDYSYAEPYFFGKGQGCGFVSNKCSSTNPAFDEFCSGTSRGCSPHGRSGGKCTSDSKADGCRWVKPDIDYDCENDDGEDYARLPSLQTFGRGAGSKCFTGDLNTRRSTGGRTTWCFKYTCSGSGSDTELQVKVGKNTIQCTKAGRKTIRGYYGSIDCPDPLEFCNTVGKQYCPRNCMGRGTCVNNKCQCRKGFKGVDCGLNV